MRTDTVVTHYQMTPAALDLYRGIVYGLDWQQAETLVTTAGQIAAEDERVVVSRNDVEAARMQVGG